MTRQWIATAHPRFQRQAIEELELRAPVDSARWLAPDAVLIATSKRALRLDRALRDCPAVFVEHLAPVDACQRLVGGRGDLDALCSAVGQLNLPRGRTIAVDCRLGFSSARGPHADALYTARDIEIALGTTLADAGVQIDLAAPDLVVHVYLSGPDAYLGARDASVLLRRFADPLGRGRSSVVVSRAEHKLDEALSIFGIAVHSRCRVIDLGAAPGGWSYLLAERGARVTAVDPAQLHPLAAKHERFDHLRVRAEAIPHLDQSNFDLIVNDMSLDPPHSAKIMRALADSAAPGTPAIMTLKLPTRNLQRWDTAARAELEGAWRVVAARHLAANRQEITWLLQRDPP